MLLSVPDDIQPTGPCLEELLSLPDPIPIGTFVPRCDDDGYYLPEQCSASTAHCWCVTRDGEKILGTETGPGEPRFNCTHPLGPCHAALLALPTPLPIGLCVPRCESDGYYSPQQCCASTAHCWCATPEGVKIPGTETGPGEPRVDCSQPLGPCHEELLALPHPIPIGTFVPRCEADGYYSPQQCSASTGHCWCVTRDGVRIPGTDTGPGEPRVDCSNPSNPCGGKEIGPCIKKLKALPRPIPIGAFVPKCDDDGYYSPQQLWGSTGEAWCVTREGKEIKGTRTSPGQPRYDCNKGTAIVTGADLDRLVE